VCVRERASLVCRFYGLNNWSCQLIWNQLGEQHKHSVTTPIMLANLLFSHATYNNDTFSFLCILSLLASNEKIRLYNFITGAKDELVLALRISHTNTLTTNIKHILYTSARWRRATTREHRARSHRQIGRLCARL
jgi:hypothetical protein